ncbi:MAG: outer membrane beta-barrel protein [Bryobacteraceae bacterium]
MNHVFLLFLLLAPAALAQRTEGRFTLGTTSFYDDGTVNHLTAGGSLRLYLTRRWSIEPEFLYMYMRNTGFSRERDYLLWGNISFDFRDRDRRVVPSWFAAPGLVYHRTSFGQFTFSTTEGAFSTGAGVRIFLNDRWFVTPQVRVGIADGIFGEVTGSIGYVFRK